jgi:hypothetical protein
MGAKAFSAFEVPESFKLENYDVCASWGVAEWRRALSSRYFLGLFSDLSPEDYREPDDLAYIQRCTLANFESPLPQDDVTLRPFGGRPSPIRDLSAMDFFAGLFAVDNDAYAPTADLAKKVAQKLKEQPWSVERESASSRAEAELAAMPAWKIHRNADQYRDRFCIEVDLGTSDTDLLIEFKRWLKETRKAANIPKMQRKFGSADFADWHTKRLLPYIDLTFWSRAHGVTLTLPMIGHAIFPDEQVRGVESMIRRTIAPAARSLFSWAVTSALNAQSKTETQNK